MSNIESHGLQVKLDVPYEDALERTTAALKEQGFGVLTQIDVRATLKKKLNADFRRYIILGACNPPLAHQVLQTELQAGLVLPCNVVVYEEDGGSVVSIADPLPMIGVVGNADLEPLAREARTRLQRVIEALGS